MGTNIGYNVSLVSITLILLGVASILYSIGLYGDKPAASKSGTWVCLVAVFVSTAALGLRWLESNQMGMGRLPFAQLFEWLVFFAWSVILFLLLVERKYESRAFGAFVTPIAFMAVAFARFFTTSRDGEVGAITPVNPALQSSWLDAHVITFVVGSAAVTISTIVAIMYLFKAKSEGLEKKSGVLALFPAAKSLDDLIYWTIVWGFPFITASIITFAAWSNYAWGVYWSWDPIEISALAAWLAYTAFICARNSSGWHGGRAVALSIIGFLLTAFCWLTSAATSFLKWG